MACIAVGANLGDRARTIHEALDRLRGAAGVQRVTASRLFETPPVGGPAGQGLYLNGAALVETTLEARPFLRLLQAIEHALGRDRRERWGPRTLDLDLLLFDDEIITTDDLTVPHARMHERLFVLEPLAQIAPQRVHPVLGRTVRQLLEDRRREAVS